MLRILSVLGAASRAISIPALSIVAVLEEIQHAEDLAHNRQRQRDRP